VAQADTVTVESGSLYFCDPSFQNGICDTAITVGDTVLWDNVEGLHTVTQCNAEFTACPPSGGFDSGFLSDGDTFSHTFDSAGTFPYWCDLHPFDMRGRVIVQEPTPTPTPEPTAEPTITPAGQTPAPSPTMTPGSVPQTGGPSDDDPVWPILLVMAGAIVLAAATAVGLGIRRY
jgi:plastocyanin